MWLVVGCVDRCVSVFFSRTSAAQIPARDIHWSQNQSPLKMVSSSGQNSRSQMYTWFLCALVGTYWKVFDVEEVVLIRSKVNAAAKNKSFCLHRLWSTINAPFHLSRCKVWTEGIIIMTESSAYFSVYMFIFLIQYIWLYLCFFFLFIVIYQKSSWLNLKFKPRLHLFVTKVW